MKVHSLVLSALAASLLSASVYAATTSAIGVVDVKKVFSSSKSVAAEKTKLQSEFKSKHEELVADKKQLDGMVEKYKRNEAVMNSTDKKNLQMQITAQQNKIFQLGQLYSQQAEDAQSAAMQTFVNNLEAAAATVAKNKHLDLVLPNTSVVYASQNDDVTADVVKAINS